jgi:putative membrane protein
MSTKAPLVAASAAATLAAGLLTVFLLDLGPMATQMAWHIALMNLAAPLAALAFADWAFAQQLSASGGHRGAFWSACLLQIVLLWFWHAPPLHHLTQGPVGGVAMQASLFLAAAAFWTLLLDTADRHGWQAILGLLLTGKLACLLGALLIFSPRLLYAGAALDDQQLAGLLMITACPASYLVTGVVIAARTLVGFGGKTAEQR